MSEARPPDGPGADGTGAVVQPAAAVAPSERLVGIQYMRAIAAMAVVAYHILEIHVAHTPGIPAFIVATGAAGVDIFFVVSGFIMMASSFSGDAVQTSSSTFLLRRAVRIYPLYLVLASVILVLWLLGFGDKGFGVETTVRSMLLLPAHGDVHYYAWTLKYEIYFYAVFAIFLLAKSRSFAVLGTIIILLSGHLMSASAPDSALRAFLADPISFEFAFGLLLGYLYTTGSRLFEARGWLTVVALAAVAMMFAAPAITGAIADYGIPADVRVLMWGLPSMAIVAWSVALPALKGRAGKLLLLIGNASYALYLSHYFVMQPFKIATEKFPVLQQAPLALTFPVLFVVSTVGGIAVYLWLEKPLTAAVSRWSKPFESASSKELAQRRKALAAMPTRAPV